MTPELCFRNQDVSPTSPQTVGFNNIDVEGMLLDPCPPILGHDRNKPQQDGALWPWETSLSTPLWQHTYPISPPQTLHHINHFSK